jgi:hypothetical protein
VVWLPVHRHEDLFYRLSLIAEFGQGFPSGCDCCAVPSFIEILCYLLQRILELLDRVIGWVWRNPKGVGRPKYTAATAAASTTLSESSKTAQGISVKAVVSPMTV